MARWKCIAAAVGAGILVTTSSLAAQLATDANVRDRVAAGFETEQYLRTLQVAGIAPIYPWSIRAFSPLELNRLLPDSVHPWSAHLHRDTAAKQLFFLSPEIRAVYNTTVPYGFNDGAMWAGRGLTTDVQFGAGFILGPLSLMVAPEAFRAENASFPLQPNGRANVFADPNTPISIDQPQRFGNSPYSQLSMGQSTLRLDWRPVTLGFSTANEYWGPATAHPAILGNNAGGFPHAFLGTAHPISLWALDVHVRALWGRLDQSDYSPLTSGETRRFASGLVGLVTSRFLPGFEFGVSRFYHKVWPEGGPKRDDVLQPLTLHNFAASTANITGAEVSNELASVFARWLFPGAGAEVYGEFFRDDFSADIIDVIAEPDHNSAYMFGMLRTWRPQPQRIVVFRAEVLNSRWSHLALVRPQGIPYEHSPIVQGHTELGQVLGAPGMHGGGAADLSATVYDPGGSWTIGLTRMLASSRAPNVADTFQGLTAERLWFGRRVDVRAGVTQAIEFNRKPGTDIGNLNLQLSAIAHW